MVKIPPWCLAVVEARRELKMTQHEFGALVGVTEYSVARWENGYGHPPLARRVQLVSVLYGINAGIAERLAQAYGISVPAFEQRATKASAPAVSSDAALASLLYALADAVDVTPRQARLALRVALDALAASGLSLAEARAALDRASKKAVPAPAT